LAPAGEKIESKKDMVQGNASKRRQKGDIARGNKGGWKDREPKYLRRGNHGWKEKSEFEP